MPWASCFTIDAKTAAEIRNTSEVHHKRRTHVKSRMLMYALKPSYSCKERQNILILCLSNNKGTAGPNYSKLMHSELEEQFQFTFHGQ